MYLWEIEVINSLLNLLLLALYYYLFSCICGLFNDAVSRSDNMESSDKTTNE
jgi:hypothetical protein